MKDKQQTTLNFVLNGLMTRYKVRVPAVEHIIEAMIKKDMIASIDDVVNDHIAFRTLGVDLLGIQSLEKIFLAYGYTRKDRYDFSKKKLNACWYSPPTFQPNLPRVFISECRVHEFSPETQTIVHKYASEVSYDPVERLDLYDGQAVDQFLHTPLWTQPTWEDYQSVAQESEYVSWVLNNRYYLNHFTISIHELPNGYNTIDQFNDFLESIGILLNDAGGKIKVSQDRQLLQSASVSNKVHVPFVHHDGAIHHHDVPGSYVEFAQRIDGRDGFDPGNANSIFESTYLNQVDKS